MELQTSTFAQQDLYNLIQGDDCDWENFEKNNLDHNYNYYEMGFDHHHHHQYYNMPVPAADVDDQEHHQFPAAVEEEEENSGSRSASSSSGRRKRRSRTTKKNQEDIENQRMAHIAIERNRRKQMNDYLTILRRLIPDYYVIKADQASIIGGAINYVKELEQQLQFLRSAISSSSTSSPFSEFFTFPQYSSKTTITTNDGGDSGNSIVPRGKNAMTAAVTTTAVKSGTVNYDQNDDDDGIYNMPSSSSCDQINDISLRYAAAADIEVTMVENHANLKVRSKRRPKQLVKMISGLQNLNLTVLHLNVVTTVDQFVLYSLCLKVEDECNLGCVDEIAAAVNQILSRIQEEEACWLYNN